MSKLKIFSYHLLGFISGAVVIGMYFANKISNLPAKDAPAGIALLVVAVVYAGGFGILCLISFIFFIIKNAKKKA